MATLLFISSRSLTILVTCFTLSLITGCSDEWVQSPKEESPALSYKVGGTLNGLTGTVVLRNKGGDHLTLSADGNFIFSTAISDLAGYSVTVSSQPAGQTCSVNNGSGTLAGTAVSSVLVTCVPNTVISTYSISGNLSGVSGTVVLQNNNGDDLTLSVNGSFTFATEVIDLQGYDVTVSSQPAGQSCSVSSGTGTVNGLIVTDVQVTCSATVSSYTKIGNSGTPLADQTLAYDDNGSEFTNDKWDCVMDNDTGLLWEVKTDDGGLRDKDWAYTWYDTNPATNGGDWGIGDTGVGTTTGYETLSGIYLGSDNCSDSSRCDTEKFVEDVNNNGNICGHTDWRLPTKTELDGLVNCSHRVDCDRVNAPLLDQGVFPNTQSWAYWSSSVSPHLVAGASNVYFSDYRYGSAGSKVFDYHLRLVRGGEPLSIAIAGAGTVSDDPANDTGCSADCTQYYTVGDTVTLTATAESGQQFSGWSGDCDSISGNECTLTITTGQSVAASFAAPNPNTTGYIKMDSSGGYLADTASDWDCVMDNDSGLMWEVKTDDDGLRDKDWTYTWYDTSSGSNGGDHGIGDTGLGMTTGFENYSWIETGSDNCFDSSRCDTKKFVEDVNSNGGICGHTDWRLPTKTELDGLVNCSYRVDCDINNSPLIDQDFFPKIQGGQGLSYWTSSAHSIDLMAWYTSFNVGFTNTAGKNQGARVRLVLDTQ